MNENVKYYRILPVQVPGHELKKTPVLSEILGYELYRQEGIKLVKVGVYDTVDTAKLVATRQARPFTAKFV